MKMIKKHTIWLMGIAITLIACNKEPDSPPIQQLPESNIVTIVSLRSWQIAAEGPITFEDSLSVYGIVSMDESSGNIYKNIYLQDDTTAINVRMTSASYFVQGDSIRIALYGATLSEYNGVIQLDGIDPDKQIVVQSKNNDLAPKLVTIPGLAITMGEEDAWAYESRLIKLENVQFKFSELNNTYADAVNQSSENRTLKDFDGNEIFVRTSGFADFAADSLPKGSGSIVCIASEYNGELQLLIRSKDEVLMNNERGPGELLLKDFDDDDIFSGGWTVQNIEGTHTWETGTLGGWEDAPYAVISNYDGGNTACESWLISPPLDLSETTDPVLNFDNAYNFSGDPLELLVSVDYPETGDPNGYTWTALSATWSGGGFDFVNSGDIDLSEFMGTNVHIAFKYTGTDFSGRTWEIDNITING
ncbi:MAG: DUF5689 domain-containing protein [Crocinitomicaceae bacterium]